MIPEELQKPVVVVIGLAVLCQPIILFMVARGLNALKQVRDHLAAQNGRIAKMEVKIDRAEHDIERQMNAWSDVNDRQFDRLSKT